MSERLDEFGSCDVAIVTFTDPSRLDAYVQHLGVPFPVVTDAERELYAALGIERGTRRQVWSLGTLRKYWQLLRSGKRLQRSREDVRQLGADVIVARDGTIVKVFAPATPDARPTVDHLLAALPDPA